MATVALLLLLPSACGAGSTPPARSAADGMLECEDPRQDFPRCKRKVPAAGRCRPGTGPPPNTTSACIVWSTISPELAAKVGARVRCASHYLRGLVRRPTGRWASLGGEFHDWVLGAADAAYKFPGVPFQWPGEDYGRQSVDRLRTITLGTALRRVYSPALLDGVGNPAVLDVLELTGTGEEWSVLEGLFADAELSRRLRDGALARQIVLRAHLRPRSDAPSRDPAVVFARATSEEGRGFVKRVRVPVPSKYAHVSEFHPAGANATDAFNRRGDL
ncbi:pyrophosphatase [Aureococcus anophagefferens]|nr:pyrophosphatase [Aureococcus anophagefferens]